VSSSVVKTLVFGLAGRKTKVFTTLDFRNKTRFCLQG
jgi:hypothetical protein